MAKTKRKKIRVPRGKKKALVCHFCERNKCSSGAVRPYCAVSNWSCKDLQMKKGWLPMMSVCLWWLDRHLIPILQSKCAFGAESLFLMWYGMDCYTSCRCIQLSCSCYWILAVFILANGCVFAYTHIYTSTQHLSRVIWLDILDTGIGCKLHVDNLLWIKVSASWIKVDCVKHTHLKFI